MEEFELQNVKSLLPPLYYELSKVKEYELGYKYYQVRHPGAIFSTVFTETITSLNSLYKKVNNIQAITDVYGDDDRDELISLTKDFLLRLVNYFESGYEIFLCFSPTTINRPAPKEKLYRWFTEQTFSSSLDNYFPTVDVFLKKYRKLLNALKHSSNQLRIFQFINPGNTGSTAGFYIEGVNADGAIGPLADFHPMTEGRYTAWSYNLHMKNFYFLVYKIALEMEIAVISICSANSISLQTLPDPLASPNLESIAKEAFQNISRLSNPIFVHFPQESKEETMIPSISASNKSLIFTGCSVGEKVVPKGSRAVMCAKGDGFSRTFSLPYFKSE